MQDYVSQKAFRHRVPSLALQEIPDISDAEIDNLFLIPNYHLHLMPDQSVVYPPNDELFWDASRHADEYEKNRCDGVYVSSWCRFPVKTAMTQVQFVNDVARDIYYFTDGKRTGDAVYRQILEKYNESYGTHHKAVRDFIRKMVALKHLSLSDVPVCIGYTISGSEEYLVPVHASLEVTAKCNARCLHCYGAFENARENVMPTEADLKLLSSLRMMGVRGIELTGGECSTHPDFTTILEKCLALFDLVGILTNGIRISQDVFDLADKFPYKLTVQISINGREQYHDKFVAYPGSFKSSSNSILQFAQRGVFVRVPMNLMVENVDDMEYVLEHAMHCGTSAFAVAHVDVSQGRGALLSENCCARRQTELKGNLLIDHLARNYPGFVSQGIPKELQNMAEYDGSCGAGRRAIYITSDGFLHFCPMSIGTGSPGYGTIESYINRPKPCDTPLSRLFYKIPAPNPTDCADCLCELECRGCLIRGIRRYREQQKCPWSERHQLNTILSHAKEQHSF